MRRRIMQLAAVTALAGLAVVTGGCGGASAPATAPAGSQPAHTVDGITFRQAAAVTGADGVSVTFTVANGTTGYVRWEEFVAFFVGAATSASGQSVAIPASSGTKVGISDAVDIPPGRSASETELVGLAPGTYRITTYIPLALIGTAFGPTPNSPLPGDPKTTDYANPVTITVP